jgi:hypothetical protein
LGPTCNDRCASKREAEGDFKLRDEQKKKQPCEYRGSDRSHAALSQGTPEASKSWKKQGKILLWRLQREYSPRNTLIFNFVLQNLEKITFCS